MEEYVYIEGKKYRRGYTTGSCATAAAKAAVTMLLLQKPVDYIQIDTPKGISLSLQVLEARMGEGWAECAIRKDGGDDVDATHGMLIYAHARWIEVDKALRIQDEKNQDIQAELLVGSIKESSTQLQSKQEILEKQIKILGGKGIGTITEKGLSLEVGEPAINPTPRKMIRHEVSKVIGDRAVEITIFAPQGEEIARKTFNPKLGIIGGISIIGTTGIVEPMSDEGWKRSMSIELEMKHAQGLETILLVPGNQGERFAGQVLGVKEQYVTRMSNFIGYMLMECVRLGYKKIVLAGPLGKFIKLAAGIFHTHSRVADGRSEILVANLALMGASLELLQEVDACVTTEAAIKLIDEAGMNAVYEVIAKKCQQRAIEHLRAEGIEVEIIIFSMAGEELVRTAGAGELLEDMK